MVLKPTCVNAVQRSFSGEKKSYFAVKGVSKDFLKVKKKVFQRCLNGEKKNCFHGT